ncbi:hypothetical protein F5Y14DRAFT_454880 [Nemania sp. NC0429]|nr:hypothetical protein F5Y14DRAFT_454880 [Nemania sp. NC0429]
MDPSSTSRDAEGENVISLAGKSGALARGHENGEMFTRARGHEGIDSRGADWKVGGPVVVGEGLAGFGMILGGIPREDPNREQQQQQQQQLLGHHRMVQHLNLKGSKLTKEKLSKEKHTVDTERGGSADSTRASEQINGENAAGSELWAGARPNQAMVANSSGPLGGQRPCWADLTPDVSGRDAPLAPASKTGQPGTWRRPGIDLQAISRRPIQSALMGIPRPGFVVQTRKRQRQGERAIERDKKKKGDREIAL